MRITRKAFAKVNLALAVGPALPASDANAGMHPIASWMHSIDLYDEVDVEPLMVGPSRYETAWAADAPRPSQIDWTEEQDLGVRAHWLMEKEAGRALPVSLWIDKRIPVGGGLGGGSSDAAAVMMAVNEAFGLGVSATGMAEISRTLGSDVAFFLDEMNPARPAVVAGLGDRVERVGRSAGWVVLVIPEFGCPTGAVYKAFDRLLLPEGLRGAEVRAMAGGRIEGRRLFNDLADAAGVVEPRMPGLMEAVRKATRLPVSMSGSGSTVFVVASDEGSAGVISGKIRAGVPDVTVVGVRLV